MNYTHAGGLSFANFDKERLPWIDKVAAFAIVAVLVYLTGTENLLWVPFVFGAVVSLIGLLWRWPEGAVFELLLASSIPRWFFSVSSWNAKPEHVVAAACGGVLLLRIVANKHKWEPFEKMDLLLLAFLGVNYVSSVVFSPEPSSTLRWSLLQTIAASPFFLIRQLVRTKNQFERAMVWWLWIGVLEALFGILCYCSHIVFGTGVGVTIFFYLGFIPGVHGTMWEPNIFGSYCTCFAVMFLFYFFAGERKNTWFLAGFGITTIGLFLSLARQAWACLILVGGLVCLYNLRPTKGQFKRFAGVAIGIGIALLVALLAMAGLSDRFKTLSVEEAAQDPTLVRRAMLITLAMEDIAQHPVIGLGSSSFQLLYLGEDDSYQGVGDAWLGSLFFRVVHDTGIIGMTFLGWFVINLGRRAWRAVYRFNPFSVSVGALLAGALVMLITYQLTDASTLAFTWTYLGLLAVGTKLAEQAMVEGRVSTISKLASQ